MPSPWHDTIDHLVDEDPTFAVTLFRELLGGAEMPRMPAQLGPTVFNTRPSRDLIADKVVLVGQAWAPSRVLIVEAQREQVGGKLEKLPMYAAAAWLQYDCPADVLVICPDRKTAAWYAQPVITGMGTTWFRARVLLRSIMATTHWPVYSDLAKEHFGKGQESGLEQGLEQGQVADRRDGVLTIVDERGILLTEDQRGRIAECTDLAQLKKWFKAAITAKTADDLFD